MRLGIDFGGTNIKFGLFDEDGSSCRFMVKKLSLLKNEKRTLSNLLEETEEFIKGNKPNSGGLSIKGLIDRKSGTLMEDIGAANEFAGINLRDAFAERLGIPFEVDNDARAYALGEKKFGAGKDFNSVIVMTLGTGVGCAAISDGNLIISDNPLSGILGGHISIDRHGPDCPCGNKGCLELYCSASAFEEEVLLKFPELKENDNPLKLFFKIAAKDEEKDEYNVDNRYRLVLNEFQENLAIGIVNVVHAYGISNIILGGGMMKSHEVILPGLIQIVSRRAWTVPRGRIIIRPAELEDKAACIGAAFMNI